MHKCYVLDVDVKSQSYQYIRGGTLKYWHDFNTKQFLQILIALKIFFSVNLNTLAFGLQLMLNPRQIMQNMQCPATACMLSIISIDIMHTCSAVHVCDKLKIGLTLCLQRDRLVTQLCLHVWSGGTPLLFACQQEMSFQPGQPAP